MWDQATRTRFSELREKEHSETLSADEQIELTGLLQQLEELESGYLTRANERIQGERQRLRTTNESLLSLVERKENLIQRLEAVLKEARAERAAIDAEVSQLLEGRASISLASNH